MKVAVESKHGLGSARWPGAGLALDVGFADSCSEVLEAPGHQLQAIICMPQYVGFSNTCCQRLQKHNMSRHHRYGESDLDTCGSISKI